MLLEVGKVIKAQREEEFYELHGCYLTDEVRPEEDPALTDPELEKRLEENRIKATKKLNEVRCIISTNGSENTKI